MWGSSAPDPRTSQALSPAAAISGRPTGMPVAGRGGGADRPERSAGRHQLRQPAALDRQRQPCPVARLRPPVGTIVKRHVSDLRRNGVHEPPRQPLDEEPGQVEVPPDPSPHLRLARPDEMCLGLRLEHRDHVAHPGGPERESPPAADPRQPLRPALIEPDHGRSERLAGLVGDHHGSALGRQGHARQRVPPAFGEGPQLPARLADRAPVELRVLLADTRRAGDVRLDRHLRPCQQVAGRVEDHRPHALRPDVEREDPVRGHLDASGLIGAAPRSAVPLGAQPCRSERSTPGFISPSGSKVRTIDCSAAMPSGPFSAARYDA